MHKNISIGNKSYENVSKFSCLRIALTNAKEAHNEIRKRIYSVHAIQKLSSRLIFIMLNTTNLQFIMDVKRGLLL